MQRWTIALGGVLLLAGACTWTPVTAEGAQVQLASAKFVEGCQSIGKTRAKTADSVGIFARSEEKIRDELISLARNQAAEMGATTISPLGPVEDGAQTFGVYVCKGG